MLAVPENLQQEWGLGLYIPFSLSSCHFISLVVLRNMNNKINFKKQKLFVSQLLQEVKSL